MNGIQKVIKYIAIAFAFFLTFSIISGIISVASSLSNIFTDEKTNEKTDNLKELAIESKSKNLDIDIASSNIIIKVGEVFKVETSNEYIKLKQEKDVIYITEKSHNWFKNDKSELIIYIPTYFILDKVSISNGAGTVNIENLSTKTLNLNLGAGKVDIDNLTVSNNTKIDGGAGEVTINNSNLNNLDLDIGVGKFNLTSKITGESEIDHGIGEVILNLIKTEEDYQIHVDKGIGSINIDGNNISDDETYGNGLNKIDIDGGVGSIKINFKN